MLYLYQLKNNHDDKTASFLKFLLVIVIRIIPMFMEYLAQYTCICTDYNVVPITGYDVAYL